MGPDVWDVCRVCSRSSPPILPGDCPPPLPPEASPPPPQMEAEQQPQSPSCEHQVPRSLGPSLAACVHELMYPLGSSQSAWGGGVWFLHPGVHMNTQNRRDPLGLADGRECRGHVTQHDSGPFSGRRFVGWTRPTSFRTTSGSGRSHVEKVREWPGRWQREAHAETQKDAGLGGPGRGVGRWGLWHRLSRPPPGTCELQPGPVGLTVALSMVRPHSGVGWSGAQLWSPPLPRAQREAPGTWTGGRWGVSVWFRCGDWTAVSPPLAEK